MRIYILYFTKISLTHSIITYIIHFMLDLEPQNEHHDKQTNGGNDEYYDKEFEKKKENNNKYT